LLQSAAHRDAPVKIANIVRSIMSRLAGLINKEKNRRIVSAMFSSGAPETLSNVDALSESPLSDQLITLERVIFEEGVVIDQACSDVLISELEAIANELL
jgi:hypothetical protein